MAAAEEHPNPTFARAGWVSLDGPWAFCLGAAGDDPLRLAYDRTITVPFPPEATASGIGVDLAEEPRYRRSFTATRRPGRRVLLHFEGVDHVARVWVDGHPVGGHEGGYTPFTLDVTDALAAADPHELVVAASDPALDATIPRGKQTLAERPAEIWYRRSSGLWRSVWLEDVPTTRLDAVRWVTGDPAGTLLGTIDVAGVPAGSSGLRVGASFRLGEQVLAEVTVDVTGPTVELVAQLAGAVPAEELLWHPDHPRLVDVELTLTRGDEVLDRVASYTGLRTVGVDRGRVLVNGRPTFQRLVLEQAYWPETQFTAPSTAALRREAELIRGLGFNGLRMHQVSADPRFLRACDELGLMVWADVPAAQAFSETGVARTASALTELVARDRNHPSVVAWVPFNESWGVPGLVGDHPQRRAVARLYELAKTLDPTRLALGNDGWEHVVGDVIGVHDYTHRAGRLRAKYLPGVLLATLTWARPNDRQVVVGPAGRNLTGWWRRLRYVAGLLRQGTPVLLTEFGGVSLDSGPGAWEGYGHVASGAGLVARVSRLVAAVGPASGLAGFCWTQLTDTLQEQNGLAWPDRTPKAPLHRLARAIRRSSRDRRT